jgi:hypothetical protein
MIDDPSFLLIGISIFGQLCLCCANMKLFHSAADLFSSGNISYSLLSAASFAVSLFISFPYFPHPLYSLHSLSSASYLLSLHIYVCVICSPAFVPLFFYDIRAFPSFRSLLLIIYILDVHSTYFFFPVSSLSSKMFCFIRFPLF